MTSAPHWISAATEGPPAMDFHGRRAGWKHRRRWLVIWTGSPPENRTSHSSPGPDAERTPDHGLVVASSMPVRDLDTYAATGGAPVLVAANRGASGIDGTVATAAGFARGLGRPVTLLIGDLALLHDLNSLAMLRDVHVVVVVLNNDGGGISPSYPSPGTRSSSRPTSERRRAWASSRRRRCSASPTSIQARWMISSSVRLRVCQRLLDPDRNTDRPRGECGAASQAAPRGGRLDSERVSGPDI